MKKLFLLITFLPLFSISQPTKKVLLIGMDGCRADALSLANTPNIDNLITTSVFSFDH